MLLNENEVVYFSNIKGEEMDYEKIVRDLNLQSENILEEVPLNVSRKRMRLHQLTWEEKIQRKKLRNRIAAQTSRDRKKAKMDYLEESVKELKEQNQILFSQVEELKKKNEVLLDANAELQKALSQTPYTCSCFRKNKEEESRRNVERPSETTEQTCVKDGHFERPAESSKIPPQKGRGPTLAQTLTKMSQSLWNIFLLYLLSQKYWEISREIHSSMTLKVWQQVCWKKLNTMRAEETQNLYSKKFQKLANKNASLILKWWGKHQKTWNPVEVKSI